jgi:hypothetical protein
LKIFLVCYYLFILGLENRFKRCDARINKFILTNTFYNKNPLTE